MSEEINVSKQWIAKAKNDWFMLSKEDAGGSKKSRITCHVVASKCTTGSFFRIIHDQNEGTILKVYPHSNFVKHYMFCLTLYPLFLYVL